MAIMVLGGSSSVSVGAAGSDAVIVSAGLGHTCAVLADRTAECWGSNSYGQLGNGTTTYSGTPAPVPVPGLTAATAMSTGHFYTCAVLANGTAQCWGQNIFGQLGNGTTDGSSTPVAVTGLTTATAISAGRDHTCALLANGTAECWGHGLYGALGNGTNNDSPNPVAVTGLTSATAISAGYDHTCALLANGTAECWGRGFYGALGNGTNNDSPTPVPVKGLTSATAISAGDNHTCALLTNGAVQCWGWGPHGELGDGTRATSATPVSVTGVASATAISAGGDHTCAVLANGTAECWGDNAFGQLGNGTTNGSSTPAAVTGLTTARTISNGVGHTCAMLSDGAIDCWGGGGAGELGDGKHMDSTVPVRVASVTAQAPVFGSTTNVQPVSGTVLIRLPGTTTFVPLSTVETVPLGTTIDTTNGKVKLTSAKDTQGHTQSGRFYDGVFRTSQVTAPGRKGLTVLKLTGALPSGCNGARRAVPARSGHGHRRLWGDAKGNFRTAGRFAAATVRGTRWLVEDRCDGTLVRVVRGVVVVNDLVRHRTVVVRAGHSYLARSRPATGTRTVRGFTAHLEGLLARLAHGRAMLKTALGGAVGCSLSLHAAGLRVGAVVANRSAVSRDLAGLRAPTARAAKVATRLRQAVGHSIAADRHYRAWLTTLERTQSTCPLRHTSDFDAAGREDIRTTAAKRRFVAAFNPLARRQHLRTWQIDQF